MEHEIKYYTHGTQDATKSSMNRNGENTVPIGNTVLLKIKKVNQSRYRPGVAQRVPGR